MYKQTLKLKFSLTLVEGLGKALSCEKLSSSLCGIISRIITCAYSMVTCRIDLLLRTTMSSKDLDRARGLTLHGAMREMRNGGLRLFAVNSHRESQGRGVGKNAR